MARGAQGGADPVAVHPRQHDVEDDEVVSTVTGPVQPFEAVVDHVHGEPFGGEPPGQGDRQPLLVLHDQQAHVHSVANGS